MSPEGKDECFTDRWSSLMCLHDIKVHENIWKLSYREKQVKTSSSHERTTAATRMLTSARLAAASPLPPQLVCI